MSYSATIDGKLVADVATNSGWYEFTDWADEQEGSELIHLALYGWADDLPALRDELTAALENAASEDIKSIGAGLVVNLRDREGVLVISDGMGEGEE